MIKEHLVGALITNGDTCICNPEILLGTNFGLWDFKNETAPKGALVDLNAAWELFLSNKDFDFDVTFKEDYHPLREVIDGVVYESGDTTYTLMDGNLPTKATFTIKANKGPIEHIEWQNGRLYLYYTKTRDITDADLENPDTPIHYVVDDNGEKVINTETGKYLIYDYVSIPIIEIFDNDETHTLFPWFADSLHTVRLRQTLDDLTEAHLGDLAVTSDSELFIAKERHSENEGNTLISFLSLYEQLKTDLGITPIYETVDDLIDTEGLSIHQRANGSNREDVLTTTNKDSLVAAINEDKFRTIQNTRLLSGNTIEPSDDWSTFLEFSQNVPNNINNLLAALNWIQDSEIGPLKSDLNIFITKKVEGEDVSVENITEALNSIFTEAEENKNRIGYDSVNKQWIALNTDFNETLTEAINEVDLHANALASIAGVHETTNNKIATYLNSDLNQITKNRLTSDSGPQNSITLVASINELLNQIGNLDSAKSRNTNKVDLTTDNKNTVVEAINEIDLHADNNYAAVGGTYTVDSTTGVKNGVISNLNTTSKNTIVDAINELDSRIGDLSNLDTDDLNTVVDSINEVIAESPFIYQDVNNSQSGVILKRESSDTDPVENTAGINSLALGTYVEVGEHSIGSGKNNLLGGNYGSISGLNNRSQGDYNNVSGRNNTVKGSYNLVHGLSSNVNSNNSTILGKLNIVGDTGVNTTNSNITVIGLNLLVSSNTQNIASIGYDSLVKGSDSYNLGSNNIIENASVSIGHNNTTEGEGNFAIGDDNQIGCENSYSVGYLNIINGGDKVFILGNNNNIHKNNDGNHVNNNVVVGKNQEINGGANNIVIGNTSKTYNEINNSIIIGEFNTPKNNYTNIGREIQIQTHETESNLQSLIFVDLNDWCKNNASQYLNGLKFLNTSDVVNAIKEYKTRDYTDKGLLRFKMQEDNQNGFVLLQGDVTRIYLNGCWYFSDNIENGWSRHEGEYLNIVSKNATDNQGNDITKHYLVLMDQLTTNQIIDVEGAQRSNTPDFGNIDLTKAYGAIDIDKIGDALDLNNRLNSKVDKSAKIITVAYPITGNPVLKVHSFIDPNDPTKSLDITLDLVEDFGINVNNFQLKSEKGLPWGYTPLNGESKIPSEYLPSYVDDVIDVWAIYTRNDLTGDIADLVLHEITWTTNAQGQRIPSMGPIIAPGELGKIYVEAQPDRPEGFENSVSHQFRWTGTQFVTIGAHLVLGEVTGTAFDGGRGKLLEDNVTEHLNSGTTYIPSTNNDGTPKIDEETGLQIYEVYHPNPHNVKANLILDVKIHDTNYKIYHPDSDILDDDIVRFDTLQDSLQELYNRLDGSEDNITTALAAIGTPLDFEDLNALDNSTDNGFDGPTTIRTVLNLKEEFDSFIPLTTSLILDLVNSNFKLLGDSNNDEPGNDKP